MTKPPSRKADFSNVKSAVNSTEPTRVDFGNVKSTVSSTEPTRSDFGNVRSSVSSTEAQPHRHDGDTQTYIVAKGDTLSHIAKRFYGKATRWPTIFEANRDQLDDPDRIRPGQVLRIPADDTPGS